MTDPDRPAVKCIAFDLDRTLLDSSGTLPLRNRAAIERAIARGITIVIASGRPKCALHAETAAIPGIKYAITGNGCAVYHLPTDSCIRSTHLKPESVEEIMRQTEKDGVTYECFINGKAYADRLFLADPVSFGTDARGVEYLRSTRIPVDGIAEFILKNKSSLDALDIIAGGLEQKTTIWGRIEGKIPDVYMTASTGQLLEISAADSGKGSALLSLLELLGISPAEAAAFGDNDNDADMLSAVGYGIAMENASESCRRAAKYITASNDNCGVAEAMEKLLKI